MRRSQTAKTFNEIVTFVNEEDRVKFIEIVIDLLKDKEFKRKVEEKQAKYKSSFKIVYEDDRLKELGIKPRFVFKFKKTKNTNEWDLDIFLDKIENTELKEFFDKTAIQVQF